MKVKDLKVLADMLVAAGYAEQVQPVMDGRTIDHYRVITNDNDDGHKQVSERFEPFYESLEGLTQFHAIEAHIETVVNLKAYQLWLSSVTKVSGVGHGKRLMRMMWVVEEYAKYKL